MDEGVLGVTSALPGVFNIDSRLPQEPSPPRPASATEAAHTISSDPQPVEDVGIGGQDEIK